MHLEDDLKLVYSALAGESHDSRLPWQAATRLEARFPPGDPLHQDISAILCHLAANKDRFDYFTKETHWSRIL